MDRESALELAFQSRPVLIIRITHFYVVVRINITHIGQNQDHTHLRRTQNQNHTGSDTKALGAHHHAYTGHYRGRTRNILCIDHWNENKKTVKHGLHGYIYLHDLGHRAVGWEGTARFA